MPVSFKVVDNRTSVSKKIKEMEDKLENFRTFFLQGMAVEIVFLSPVDTGTYITSHYIGPNVPGGFTSSAGKPKNQEYAPYAQEGLDNLFSNIAALKGQDLNSIRMTNVAGHANIVEYELGYEPYTHARRESNRIAQEAAIKAGG